MRWQENPASVGLYLCHFKPHPSIFADAKIATFPRGEGKMTREQSLVIPRGEGKMTKEPSLVIGKAR